MTQEICCSKLQGYMLVKQLGLHESTLGLLKNAEKQYRDSQGTNSMHSREFATKFCFHRDQYNPEQYPVEHILVDVVKPEALVVGSLTFVAVLASTKDWKSALGWGLGVGTLVQLLADTNTNKEQMINESKREVLPLLYY